MPLVVCPDCDRPVSDAAPACPQCGRPMVPKRAHAAPSTHATAQPGPKPAPGGRKVSGTIGCIVIAGFVVVVGLVASRAHGCSSPSRPTDERTITYKGEPVRPQFKVCMTECLAKLDSSQGSDPCPECQGAGAIECVKTTCVRRRMRTCEATCAPQK